MKPVLPLFLERSTRREVDALYVLLVHSGRYELLPELYDVFGREHLIRFLEIFGGTTIKVPSEVELAQAARDVTIYCRLNEAPKEGQEEVVASLAKEYNLDEGVVSQIYSRMVRLMETYDLRKITRNFAHDPR